MNDELKQSNWQEQSIKEMIQKNEEMGEILKHQLDIIEYEKAVDSDLVAFANKYLNGQNKEDNQEVYVICEVSQKEAEEIKSLTAADVSNFLHVIKPNVIRHIEKRHGANGQQDKSMKNIQDISRVGYIINNYDKIVLLDKKSSEFNDKNNNPALLVKYSKRVNGNYYIVEALSDTSNKNYILLVCIKKKQKNKKKRSTPPMPKP